MERPSWTPFVSSSSHASAPRATKPGSEEDCPARPHTAEVSRVVMALSISSGSEPIEVLRPCRIRLRPLIRTEVCAGLTFRLFRAWAIVRVLCGRCGWSRLRRRTTLATCQSTRERPRLSQVPEDSLVRS